MTMLNNIVDDVEQVAEAISLAIGCDVEVIDSHLTRIAATGSLKCTVGQPLRHGHIYTYLMQQKQSLVLDKPGFHYLCNSCNIRGKCYYKTSMASPIIMDNTSLGIISLISFDDEKGAQIQRNISELTKFINKMAELLASKVSEKKLLKSLQITTTELMAILNTDNRGVIAINHEGQVLHYNNMALTLLNIKRDAKAKAALERVLIDEIRLHAKTTRQKVIKNKVLLVSVEPVPVADQGKAEMLWLIICRDYANVKKTASSITLQDNIISFDDIHSQSKTMMERIQMAKKIARHDSTVLIMGESGTGKEIFARAIHFESGRSGPLIPINCGAIPESLLESELFGYEHGTFTGARKEGKPGKFELAESGTIFLDEIGTMPLHLQSKLLRILEDRRLERLGGTYSIPLDVRIITATNDDLQKKVKEGSFREDLYFRINVIPIKIPPLRERKEDIILLANHFLKFYSGKFAKNISEIDTATSSLLKSYPWPGNIRELSNTIEFAVNMEDSRSLKPDSLPSSIRFYKIDINERVQNMDELRIAILKENLNKYGYGKKGKIHAAEALGVSLATVYRWVEKYTIERT